MSIANGTLERVEAGGNKQGNGGAAVLAEFPQAAEAAAAIETARPDAGVDLLMGVGGTPEGVITAAAMICLGGSIQGQLHIDGKNSGPVLKTRDLVSSDDVFLAATGITDGELVHGIRYTPFGALSQSIVMRGKSKTVRIINTEHHLNQK
jgi:fructose-1,6-bisphosphatase II